jgi:hypothetical protein
MNIQVSKTFANFINKTAKEMGFKAHAVVITLSSQAYKFHTGTDLWDAGIDLDLATGRCKVIMVEYPGLYYACTRFLSTHRLTEEFRRRDVKTEGELKAMLRDMLEV